MLAYLPLEEAMLALTEEERDDLEEASLWASSSSFSICVLRCTGREKVGWGGGESEPPAVPAGSCCCCCDAASCWAWKCSSTHESEERGRKVKLY